MRKIGWISLFIIVLFILSGVKNAQSAPPAQATIAPSILIQSPRQGLPLQGIVTIEGKIRGEGFSGGKISFSYSGSKDPTWFFIADIVPESSDSSQANFIVNWDTTQITDGDYDVRVVAEYQNAGAIFELIPNLRIRNYSPVETSTPVTAAENGSPGQSPTTSPETSTEDILVNTPSALPVNPVVIKSDGFARALLGSGIFVALVFLTGGIYWFIKYRPDK